jgi:hypothetical protein
VNLLVFTHISPASVWVRISDKECKKSHISRYVNLYKGRNFRYSTLEGLTYEESSFKIKIKKLQACIIAYLINSQDCHVISVQSVTGPIGKYMIIIYYIIANRRLKNLVQYIKIFRGCKIGSDHFLLTSRINLLSRWKQQSKNNRLANELVYKNTSNKKKVYEDYINKAMPKP